MSDGYLAHTARKTCDSTATCQIHVFLAPKYTCDLFLSFSPSLSASFSYIHHCETHQMAQQQTSDKTPKSFRERMLAKPPAERLAWLENNVPPTIFQDGRKDAWDAFRIALEGWRDCQKDWTTTMRDVAGGHIRSVEYTSPQGQKTQFVGVTLPTEGVYCTRASLFGIPHPLSAAASQLPVQMACSDRVPLHACTFTFPMVAQSPMPMPTRAVG